MKKIQTRDIREVIDLPPRKRASLYLEIGRDLTKPARKKAPAPGHLPSALQRKSVTEGLAGPMLEKLHGLSGVTVAASVGLTETGASLKTAAGTVADMTLTPRARKDVARRAMRRRRGDSVDDLALRQLSLGMLDSDPISRISAAHGYWQATGNTAVVLPILTNAIDHGTDEQKMLAAHSLAQIDSRKVRKLQGTAADDKPQSPVHRVKKSLTLIIHGTFAKDAEWYRPGGDFHTYIKKKVYPDLYSNKNDYYFWSGRYNFDDDKLKAIWKAAAKKLVSWCHAHPARTLRLIAHSHGANVVNMATRMGLPACTLINLSIPVRDWNLPDIDQVSSRRIFTFHSAIDLVVAIDGGAQNYRKTALKSFETHKIIAPFGHSKSHEEKPWKKKFLRRKVKKVCR